MSVNINQEAKQDSTNPIPQTKNSFEIPTK